MHGLHKYSRNIGTPKSKLYSHNPYFRDSLKYLRGAPPCTNPGAGAKQKQAQNGWIIPVKDQDAILKAMRKSILEKSTINNKKTYIRNMIKKKYQQQFVWDAILKEYKFLEKKNERS